MRSYASRLTGWPAGHRAVPRSLLGIRTRTAADVALAAVLSGVALVLLLFRLPGTSLWADEAFSVGLVSNSWPLFWSYVWDREANMALYHLVLWGWLRFIDLVGLAPDELAARAPSVIFAVLGVAATFWLGRAHWDRTMAVVAAALYLLNPFTLGAGRQARSYSLQMFLVCLGWYALFAAITAERRRRLWWAAYAACMTLALYAHLFSALVLAAQVVAFMTLMFVPTEWRDRARSSIREMVTSVATICGALVPMVIYTLSHGPSNTHVPPASVLEFARLLWNLAGQSLVYGLVLGAAAIIAVVATLRAARRAGHRQRSLPLAPAVALACWLVVPVVLSAAGTQSGLNLHLFSWPYFVVIVPALCLLAGIGVAGLSSAVPRRALAVALIGAAALAMPTFSDPPAQDFRAAAGWIKERYEVGDGLICTSWSCSLAMEYYVRLGAAPNPLLDEAPAAWSWTDGGVVPLDHAAIAAYVAKHPRVFLVDGLLGGDPPETKTAARLARDWLDRGYPLLADVAVRSKTPLTVRLYEAGRPAR